MYNKKKILLILTLLMPTRQHLQRLGANIDSKNIKVKYWNLLPLINSHYYNLIKKSKQVDKNNKFIFIGSYRELFSEIKKLPKFFFFADYAGNYFLINFLKKFLEKKGGTNVLINLGGQINIKIDRILAIKFFLREKKYFFLIKKIIFYIVENIINLPINILLNSKPKILFVSDLFTYKKYKNEFKTAKIYKINGADFQNYLNFKKKGLSHKKKYITYLDQALDENFDYQLRLFKNTNFNPFNFWKKTNLFFDRIRSLYPKKSIVIAAHPNRFQNIPPSKYKCLYNQSAQLVGQSDLVITTYSLAASYAVLFHRPLVLIYSDSFNYQTFERSAAIDFYKKNLGIKSINIEKIETISRKTLESLKRNSYSKKKYEKYKNFYLGFPNTKTQGGSWSKIYKHLSDFKN